jgi:formate dehydrogenase accessory protein FdhD
MSLADQQSVSAWRIEGAERTPGEERVAEEVAVALVYNGTPHAVMMASPGDLHDFTLGFSVTEGIVESADEFRLVEILPRDSGIVVHCLVPEVRHAALRTRNLTGRGGCGLCGAESLDSAIRPVRKLDDRLRVDAATISASLAALGREQPLNRATGAVHAAALVDAAGILVREDIGRHNALDKLVGAMLRADRGPGFLLMTSRASYEIVHKSAAAGIELVAAISAPSALAIRLAEEAGLTLVGFARETRMTVYSHPRRLT